MYAIISDRCDIIIYAQSNSVIMARRLLPSLISGQCAREIARCALTTGTRNAILSEPATTAVHDNVGIDVPIIYRYIKGDNYRHDSPCKYDVIESNLTQITAIFCAIPLTRHYR